MERQQLIELTADIVSAHVSNNHVALGDISQLVEKVYASLTGLGPPEEAGRQERKPAVSIRASIKPDHLVCLARGRKQKTLRRHLTTAHALTPDQYRAEFGLPRDYPMAAPDYSEQRRKMAKAIGLGRKPRVAAAPEAAAPEGATPRRGRPRKAP